MATAVTSENILKQGYLKKSVQSSDPIPSASKQFARNIKQKLEPSRWYVFGVRNRCPYLEYFDREESVFSGQPIQSYSLSSFQSLSYTMGRTNTDYTFCIILADRNIELTAASRTQMVEWCRCLERNLRNLGIRSKNQKEDHQYSAFPSRKPADVPKTLPPEPPDIPSTASNPTLSFEESLIQNSVQNDEKEDEYEDATAIRLDNDDRGSGGIEDTATIPLRPPPVIPKRSISSTSEEIFVTLSDIRREADYNNFLGHNHELAEHEKDLVDTSTDSDSASESDENNESSVIANSAKSIVKDSTYVNTSARRSNSAEENDRVPSLPIVGSLPQESDTSEDSDFIAASFWLRNRIPDERVENRDVPPAVPRRFDSQGLRLPRNCVSMDMDDFMCKSADLTSSGSRRPDSLTGSSSEHLDEKAQCNGGDHYAFYDHPRPLPRQGLANESVSGNGKKQPGFKQSGPLIDICDTNGVDENESYETLVGSNLGPVRNIPDEEQDSVYEATWQGSSNLDSLDPFAEPVKLKVNMPNDSCEKTAVKQCKESAENDYVKPKHLKTVFSRMFSKKTKSKELPESLEVDLLPGAHGCNGADKPDGNVYSDFPLPNADQEQKKFDSDILKESIANGPRCSGSDTEIELPKRNFGELMSSTHPKLVASQSLRVSRSSMLANQNLYEDVAVTKPNTCSTDFPPYPPPPKSGVRNSFELQKAVEEKPVAPPRRQKKLTGDENSSTCNAFDSSAYGIETFCSQSSCKETARSRSNKEPALPPRNQLSKSKTKSDDSPPPPPRRNLPRHDSDCGVHRSSMGPDLPAGARPKTVHLAMRQKSFGSASSNVLNVMNLKQNQVDILISEIASTGGLVKVISKAQFQHGLALVECFGKIWISGWDVKKYPRLYDKFHIGDELITINDVQVMDLSFAHKLVKNVKADNIEITIRRIPNAKVFAIQRSAEGESLGIKRDGPSPEIVYVDPNGLAARVGLTSKATSVEGSVPCNWALTEVNMRPLNLFPKDQEIEHRLLAVGKDISIVVQPVDLVRDLKKQMKKLKGYKDYLLH